MKRQSWLRFSDPRDIRHGPVYSVAEIGELISFIKERRPDVICMVDNCYGEFVERLEPSDVGADMIVGSLIKNPGGGLAPIGGYIAGKEALIENCAYRLTSPGLGREVGASLGVMQSFYQGFFLAPTVVCGALKGAVFAANIYEKLGYPVVPSGKEEPARHYSGGDSWLTGRGNCFLQRNSGCRSGRQLCQSGTMGDAGIRQ